ncbi:hypothetical protein BDA99DRAFT_520348 [Phascolomyces articulosus]|uniref:Wax synthase domain-containing protein n=1 Tax=Phascolomyces articulosus TaxID=60185 RepID=A0AAD5JSV6_9FUNG|nr:hypothetical protein BDA99DRAFT_520348 [Phascolomyces articulosus]
MNSLSNLFQAGDSRILPGPLLVFAIFCIPTALLVQTISNEKLSTGIKQILSIPLLTIVFMTPIVFSCGNGVFDLAVSIACFNLFLRLFELYWISPLLYGKPAYAPLSYLYTEFWAPLCKFPKSPKKKGDTDQKLKPKIYIKNKKWYHIVGNMVYHALIWDVFGSWWSTFTPKEFLAMPTERPIFFFGFLIFLGFIMNTMFNMIGYPMHLFHCLYYDHGSYSDEQWRPAMKNPLFFSSSLEEFWSDRWHQFLHTSCVAFGFRPARYITRQVFDKMNIKTTIPITMLIGVFAVFFMSGLMHEYIVYSSIGWSPYSRLFIGHQLFFFSMHGVAVIFERILSATISKTNCISPAIRESFFVKQVLQRVWGITFMYIILCYFTSGFAYTGLWHDSPFMFSRPYVFEFFRSIPYGKAICGSLL